VRTNTRKTLEACQNSPKFAKLKVVWLELGFEFGCEPHSSVFFFF